MYVSCVYIYSMLIQTSRMLIETLVDRNYTVKGDIVLSEGLVSVTRDNIFVS